MNEENQPDSDLNHLGQAMGRRPVITYLLGFSIVATVGGVLTPIVSYLWPPSQAASAGSSLRPKMGARQLAADLGRLT